MKRGKQLANAASVVCTWVISLASHVEGQVFYDQASFLAAVGGPQLESFEDQPTVATHQVITPNFTFLNNLGIQAYEVFDEPLGDPPTVYPTHGEKYVVWFSGRGVGTSTFLFDNPVDAFGVSIVGYGAGIFGMGPATFSTSTGETGVAAFGAQPPGTLQFFGILSPGMTSLSLSANSPGMGIDEVYLGHATPTCMVGQAINNVLLPEVTFDVFEVPGKFDLDLRFQPLHIDFVVEAPSHPGGICAAQSDVGTLRVSVVEQILGTEVVFAGSTTQARLELISTTSPFVKWENPGFFVTLAGGNPVTVGFPPVDFTVPLSTLGLSLNDPFDQIVRVAEDHIHRQLSQQLFGFLNSNVVVLADPAETELLITDAGGMRTGRLGASVVNGIAGSAYFNTPSGPLAVIIQPEDGAYLTNVLGTTSGDYEFATYWLQDGQPIAAQVFNGAISTGEVINYASDLSAAGNVFSTILATDCDVDLDGQCNISDLNAILSEGPIAEGISVVPGDNEHLDLTNDEILDAHDVNLWLAAAGVTNGLATPYKFGDANLDGVVDGRDFIAWNLSKFSQSLLWNDGDFNGDGFVDGRDFVLWNSNKFTSSRASAVPEPTTMQFIFLWTALVALRRL